MPSCGPWSPAGPRPAAGSPGPAVAGLLLGAAALVQVQLLLPIPLALAATALCRGRPRSRAARASRCRARDLRAGRGGHGRPVARSAPSTTSAGAVASRSTRRTSSSLPASGSGPTRASSGSSCRSDSWAPARASCSSAGRTDPGRRASPGPGDPRSAEGGVLLATWWALPFALGRPLRPVVAARGRAPAAAPLAHRLTAAGDPRRDRPGDRCRAPAARRGTRAGWSRRSCWWRSWRRVPATYATASLVARTWTRDAYAMLDRELDRVPHFDALLGRDGAARDAPRARGLVGPGLVRDRPAGRGPRPAGLREARLRSRPVHRRLAGGAAGGARGGLVGRRDGPRRGRRPVRGGRGSSIPRDGERWALLDLAAAAVARADPAAAPGAIGRRGQRVGRGRPRSAASGSCCRPVPRARSTLGVRVARARRRRGGDAPACRSRCPGDRRWRGPRPRHDRHRARADELGARERLRSTSSPGRAPRDRGRQPRPSSRPSPAGSRGPTAARLADRVRDRRGHRPRAGAVTRWLRRPIVWLPISGFLLAVRRLALAGLGGGRDPAVPQPAAARGCRPPRRPGSSCCGPFARATSWAPRATRSARPAPAHDRVREHHQQPDPGVIRRGRAGVAAAGASRRAVRDGCRGHHHRARRGDRLHGRERPRRLGRLRDGPRAAAAAGAASCSLPSARA